MVLLLASSTEATLTCGAGSWDGIKEEEDGVVWDRDTEGTTGCWQHCHLRLLHNSCVADAGTTQSETPI